MTQIKERKKWRTNKQRKKGQNLEGTEIRRRKTEIERNGKKKKGKRIPETRGGRE